MLTYRQRKIEMYANCLYLQSAEETARAAEQCNLIYSGHTIPFAATLSRIY